MKKILLVGVLGLLIVALGAYFAAAYFLGSIVKAGVNRVGPKVTQTSVELASATISPLDGKGVLGGLAVGNPAGWSPGRAFYVGEMRLAVQPKSLFGDVVVIDELTIDQPEITYETKIVSSNLQDLLKNIQEFAGSGAKEDAASGPPKKFIVKKLRFTNGKAVVSAGGAAIPVALPEISLDNIGVNEGGVTATQLSVIVLRDVLAKVVAATTDAMASGKLNLDQAKETAKQLEDAVKDIFKKKP
jgi:uncharacterized protein involved in outer membrane biogenesis